MTPEMWPDLNLFPRLARIGRFMLHAVSFLPLEAPDYMSEHYHVSGEQQDEGE